MMYVRCMLLAFSYITALFVCGLPTSRFIEEDKVSTSNGLSASSIEVSNPHGSLHETSNGLALLSAAGQASRHLQHSPPPDRKQAITDISPDDKMQSRLATRNVPVGSGQLGSISPATSPSTPISGNVSLIQGNCGGLSAGANVSAVLPSIITVPGTSIRIHVSPFRSQDDLPPMAVIYCFLELEDAISVYPGGNFLDHIFAENIMGELGATVNVFPYQYEPEKITYFETKKVVRAFLDILNPDFPLCPAIFDIRRGETGKAFAGGSIKKGLSNSAGTTLSLNSSTVATVATTRRKRAAR